MVNTTYWRNLSFPHFKKLDKVIQSNISVWPQRGNAASEKIDFCLTYTARKAMAPHSGTLAWKIPWRDEPGRLQSMGSLGVGHDRVTSLSLFTFMHWRSKWQPTPVFLPGESQGQMGLAGYIHRVVKSRTWLEQLYMHAPTIRRESRAIFILVNHFFP